MMGISTFGIWPGIVIVGTKYVFSEEYGSQKDLELIGSSLENNTVQALADSISDRFGLSDQRSYRISKVIYNVKKMGKLRRMTAKDTEILYRNVLGVSHNEIAKVMEKLKEGDNTSYEKLLEKISDHNETSPEHIRDLVSDFLSE